MFNLALIFVICLILTTIHPGNCLISSRPASLQPTTPAKHSVRASTPSAVWHTPQRTLKMEEHHKEGTESQRAELAPTKYSNSPDLHEGAAGMQLLQQQKPESAAATEQTAAATAMPTAASKVESPPSAAAEGGEVYGSVSSNILKEPYERGMGKMYTESQNIVQMLQDSLKASNGLKSAANISSKLRGEIVKDVDALRHTLHKEHENLTLLREYEQQQDALLKAQLGYLTPLSVEGAKTQEEDATETSRNRNAVENAYTSQAAHPMGASMAAFSFCLLVAVGL